MTIKDKQLEFVDFIVNPIYRSAIIRCRLELSKRKGIEKRSKKLFENLDSEVSAAICEIVSECVQDGISSFFFSLDNYSENFKGLNIQVDGLDILDGKIGRLLHNENGWRFEVPMENEI